MSHGIRRKELVFTYFFTGNVDFCFAYLYSSKMLTFVELEQD